MKPEAQHIATYTYEDLPGPSLPEWLCPPAEAQEPAPALDQSARLEIEAQLAAEAARSFEAGREQGVGEGRAAESRQQEEKLRRDLAGVVEAFAAERDRYLQRVEPEVVKLALAVAARILHRESQMDPLLLTGTVRAALGQLGAATQVRLRVPAAHHELWTEAMALLPGIAVRPQVLADQALQPGECVVETEFGSADLGLHAQLREVERSFFDAPSQRPQDRDEDLA